MSLRPPPRRRRLLALWCFGPLAAACATQPKKDAPLVDDLQIVGTNALSASDVKDKILTTETGWWPFATERYFDPVEWQTDLARIERYYHARGYYLARVKRSEVKLRKAVKQGQPDEVELLVEVEENQPVRVAPLEVSGLEELTEAERVALLEDLPLAEKQIFREERWEATKAQVLRRLRDLGHARAQVDGQAVVDVGTLQARPQIRAVPGPRYRFGEIEVRTGRRPQAGAGRRARGAGGDAGADDGGGRAAQASGGGAAADGGGAAADGGAAAGGGERWRRRLVLPPPTIDPEWVKEQVALAIEGSPTYSEAALDEAQRRVFAMGVFSTVRVTADGQPSPDGRIPVVASVREGPMHTVKLGGGVGFDQIRQEGRLVAEWSDRNFFGGLRRLQLRSMFGWAFLPSTLAVARDASDAQDGPIYRAGADFDQPRLFERPSLRLRSLLESERTLEEAYNAIGGRGMLGVSWEPHSTLTLFPSYNLQGYWLNGVGSATAATAPLALGCDEDPCFVLLSYLEEVITWDRRDDRLEPRTGHYLSLSFQQGGGPLGGDFSYLRITPDLRGYVSLGDDDQFTLASRLRVGTLLTSSGRAEDSAVVTRFYAGGSQSMRGFSVRRMSPLLLVQPSGTEGLGQRIAIPIGGNGLIEGSVELRARFGENLAVAAFTDFGTVTVDRLPFDNTLRMLWAVGFGFRYLTPVGPLRLDLGFRLPFGRPPPLYGVDENGEVIEITYQKRAEKNGPAMLFPGRENGDNVNDSCFGIGGSKDSSSLWVRDSLCAFHISIGEAF